MNESMNDLTGGRLPREEAKPATVTDVPEMIPDGETPRISGRSLYRLLGMDKDYGSWFRHLVIRCGYREGGDYRTRTGRHGRLDHLFSLRMAREVCLLARCEQSPALLRLLDQAAEDWYTPERLIRIALRKREEREKRVLERLTLLEEALEKMPEEVEVRIPGSFRVRLGKEA